MCGFVGLFGVEEAASLIQDLAVQIAHRGPDAEGFWSEGNIAFGHRRLAIIDIENGTQPMTSTNGDWVVAFNGEIYNFLELKNKRYSDYEYKTDSDTEVIIAGLTIDGPRCFEQLNGMFAIVAYHKPTGRVFFGRDARGIKPLYFFIHKNALCVSSEVKPLLRLMGDELNVSTDGLYDFLSLRYTLPPMTIFDGISKAIPGTLYEFELISGEVVRTDLLNSAPKINKTISLDSAQRHLQRFFFDAVERHMISDVPVGMLLSGGVDSAAVARAAVEVNANLQTFCIGYSGQTDANEFENAQETASLLGTEHLNIEVTEEDALGALPNLIQYLEEPVVTTSTFSYFLLCNAVSKHKKVVLTGQGADEPWAGYRRHQVAHALPLIQTILSLFPECVLNRLSQKDRLARLIDVARARNETERLKSFHCVFPKVSADRIIKHTHIDSSALRERHDDRVRKYVSFLPENGSFPERLLAFDARTSLSENLLLLGDKLSMASSIEVRVPFLDKEYFEFVESLPFKFKRNQLHLSGKYLHKKMCESILPNRIVHRKKIGFQTPISKWFEGRLGAHVKCLVNSKDSFTRNYLDIAYVNKILSMHGPNNNLERQIFAIWSLEEWYIYFRRAC